MKKAIVPFIHRLTKKDELDWLKEFQKAMPNINICSTETLSKKERKSVEVAIIANPRPIDLMDLPNLKWVHSLWAGIEHLLDELTNDKISIVRLIDPQLAETMAEAVLAWTLYLHRNMPEYIQQQRKKEWKKHDGAMASETTIGILGLGQLGQKAVERLKDNGFKVLGWNRGKRISDLETLKGYDGLLEVASLSDILVILLPSTPKTRGILDSNFFSKIKQGASIINFARANIIESKSMLDALSTRRLKHAVLDVFLNEPLSETSPFWNNPYITVLPHISAPTNKHTASKIVAKNIKLYFKSNKIPQSVSRQIGY